MIFHRRRLCQILCTSLGRMWSALDGETKQWIMAWLLTLPDHINSCSLRVIEKRGSYLRRNHDEGLMFSDNTSISVWHAINGSIHSLKVFEPKDGAVLVCVHSWFVLTLTGIASREHQTAGGRQHAHAPPCQVPFSGADESRLQPAGSRFSSRLSCLRFSLSILQGF